MLLAAIYHFLKKQEFYNPELYKKEELIPISREITPKQAVYIAQRQDYGGLTKSFLISFF